MTANSQGSASTLGVIIPVYNSGGTAISAIRSVVAQVGVAVQEIVVVDDGSSDDSVDALREACKDLPIPVKILEIANSGAANARNYGMTNCGCDLYAFLDSDDTWFSEKLALQVPFFADETVGLVGCSTTMCGGGGGLHRIGASPKVIGLRHQIFKNHFQTSTVVVRRRVVEEVGPFPLNQRHAEEGDFFNRIATRYKCVLLPNVLVDYDNGKPGFGASGLSANLVAMEKGELCNIRRAYLRGDCGLGLYVSAVAFSILKFLRRGIILKFGRS